MKKYLVARSLAALLTLGAFMSSAHAAQVADGDAKYKGVTLTVGTAGPRFEASWNFANEKTPYTVKFVAFDGAAPIIEALSAGAIDIGGSGDIGVILAEAAGAKIEIVGAQRSNPEFLRLIVPQNSTAKTLSDLKGKTIAVTKATSSHMFILSAIKVAGLKVSDFKWAYLSNADAGTAFQRGDVDAWATWDPFAATAEIKWHARMIERGTEDTNGFSFWVAQPGLFAEPSAKADAARDFIARWVDVNKNEVVNREQWIGALTAAMKLDPSVARQVAEHYYFVSYPLDASVKASYSRTANLLLEQGLIKRAPSPADYFDTKSVNPAVEAAIKVRDSAKASGK